MMLSGKNNFLNNNATLLGGSGSLGVYKSNAFVNGKSTFHGNIGAHGGGIHGIQSNLKISGNVSFVGNIAGVHGGGIMYANGTLIITGQASFVKNHANSYGSALTALYSNVTFDGVVLMSGGFTNNTGALHLFYSKAVLTGDLTVRNNKASVSGCIYMKRSELEVEGCIECLNNFAQFEGGGGNCC